MYGIRIFIGAVEGFWLLITGFAIAISIIALSDAVADRRAIKSLNGRARRIIGGGNIRREVARLVINVLLFTLAIPAAFDDADIHLTPFLVVLLAVPIVILANSIFDWIERRQLSRILEAELKAERDGPRRRRDDGSEGAH